MIQTTLKAIYYGEEITYPYPCVFSIETKNTKGKRSYKLVRTVSSITEAFFIFNKEMEKVGLTVKLTAPVDGKTKVLLRKQSHGSTTGNDE